MRATEMKLSSLPIAPSVICILVVFCLYIMLTAQNSIVYVQIAYNNGLMISMSSYCREKNNYK